MRIGKIISRQISGGAFFLAALLFSEAASAKIVQLTTCGSQQSKKVAQEQLEIIPGEMIDLSIVTTESLIHPAIDLLLVSEDGEVLSAQQFSLSNLKSGTNFITTSFDVANWKKGFAVIRINERLCFSAPVSRAQITPENEALTQYVKASSFGTYSCSLQESSQTPSSMLWSFMLFTTAILILGWVRKRAQRLHYKF